MLSRAWPDSARAIISRALKVRISPSDSSIVVSSAARYCDSSSASAQRLLAAVAQPRERGLEIVGDVVGDLLEAVHERLDALEHDIEVAGEPVELVAGAGDRQPPGEIAVHDGAGGIGHGVDALEHAAGHEEAAGEAEHDDRRQRPAAGGEHDVVQAIALFEIASDQQTEAARQLEHPHQRAVLGRPPDRRAAGRRSRSSRACRARRSPARRCCRPAPRRRRW